MDNIEHLIPITRQLFELYGQEPPLPGLKITYAEAPTGLIRAVYQPSLCVVLQGAKKSVLGDQTYHYQAGECLFASADLPVSANILQASPQQPYIAFSIAINPSVVTELWLQQQAQAKGAGATASTQSAGTSSPALITAKLPPTVLDPLSRLLQLVGDDVNQPVLGPLTERELIWRLLSTELKPALCQLGVADGYNARINTVTQYLRNNYQATITVAELAAMASMSVASFHRHFKSVTQLSPVQFQKRIRLHEARRQLVAQQEIAAISYAVGYDSPSQFSRDYRKHFGLSPLQDRQELLAEVG
ncbi:AraC family transcriptional regulator [Halioxenophilus aromaticivorans]|uniref:AraC family transcriptional regulator N-terminal domain-containing protein n=1 Tax=Halioxenophilus aromaticivorans TaxID=1306992 RepID=A0AAV3U9I3_9ALTE